jgi:hypothetical protein
MRGFSHYKTSAYVFIAFYALPLFDALLFS